MRLRNLRLGLGFRGGSGVKVFESVNCWGQAKQLQIRSVLRTEGFGFRGFGSRV